MAVSNYYVDYGTGNDYVGATFTDGAFTHATLALFRDNAFTKSKVNHWLYLTDNGSGKITAGYYKVATVTSGSQVILASDPSVGNVDATDVKCVQASGSTVAGPFRSIQGALDLITRDATNGDQINVISTTAQVNAAALTLATYGTPAAYAPLILRGYTTSANDGGVGEIDCGGNTMWAATTYDYLIFVDLEMHTFGNNHGVYVDTYCYFYRCEIHKGASSPSGKYLLINGYYNLIAYCYFHDSGATGSAVRPGAGSLAIGNYVVVDSTSSYGIRLTDSAYATICNNIVSCSAVGQYGIYGGSGGPLWIFGNTVYNSAAGTTTGINTGDGAGRYLGFCMNNVVQGWSGSGGKGIGTATAAMYSYLVGNNAFFNCETTYSITSNTFINETTLDHTLAASPFVSAAGANFAINGTVTGVTEDALPLTFNGASTTNKADKGAVQSGAGTTTTGGVLKHPGMQGNINA